MATAAELAQRAADILAIEDDLMTWNGAVYSCVLGEITKTDSVEIGGFQRDYDTNVYVRTALFSGTRPNVDDEVIIGTKTLKITAIHEYPDDVDLELELKAVARA